MKKINAKTTLQEMAAIVSETLEQAGIMAVLSGGGAVAHYSENEYMSYDLDFITVERNKKIAPIIAALGFQQEGKDFFHPRSKFFLEFPPGPLAFGNQYVDSSKSILLKTQYGHVRIITPTQCVMDRLAWFIHGKDRQAKDQAMMVAKINKIDWDELYKWARDEGISSEIIESLQVDSEKK